MIFGHKHEHEPIAVQHAQTGPFAARTTIVLWRCACSDLTTQRLEGKWTLSQVRGERDLTSRERIETDVLLAAEVPPLGQGGAR